MSPSTDSTEIQILLLSIAIQANVPAMLWGPPGVAKTALMNAIGRALGYPVVTKIVSQHDPTDFGGYPSDSLDGTILRPLKWVMDLTAEKIGAARVILFFDEINMGLRSTQGAVMQLIHEGKCGEGQLGPGVSRCAAGNPPESSGNTSLFEPALANRFFHMSWTLSAQYWVDGMASGFEDPTVATLPAGWETGIQDERLAIAAYIMHHQAAMHEQPADDEKAGRAWASPRTWDMAARLLAAAVALKANDGIQARLVEGCVGHEAAFTYLKYRRELNLPNVEDALKHPEKIKWPDRGDRIYAFLNSVVNAIVQNNTKTRYGQAWDVMKLAGDRAKDVAAISARRLAKAARDENGKSRGYPPPLQAADFYEAMNMAGKAKAKVATTAA